MIVAELRVPTISNTIKLRTCTSMDIYTEIKTIKDLLKFIEIYGLPNSPYRFFKPEYKEILKNVKMSGGYSETASLREIVYRETVQKERLCAECNIPTRYSETTKELRKFCSSICSSRFNKDIITEKRKIAMAINYADEEWLANLKKNASIKSRAYNASEAGKENSKKQSKLIKSRILSGEFTPNITNSWTNWDAEYDGKKFRSLFESLFYAYTISRDSTLEYERIRIPYIYLDENKTYIPDFHSPKYRIVFEIKPSSLRDRDKNLVKEKYAIEWCKNNNYTYKIITEDKLKPMLKYIDNKDFVEKFLKKYPKWE